MSELRWNPLLQDWVIIAPKRQNRPMMLKDMCPFCPGSDKVPKNYHVCRIDNDFPSLTKDTLITSEYGDEVCKRKSAYGKCEVILYSPEHDMRLWQLADEHVKELVDLWIQRYSELKKDKRIKYIFIFENRGEMVGATIAHPHGQIYAYSYIPKRIELEMLSCEKYLEEYNECLICHIAENEMKNTERVIAENEDFIAFVPFFSDCPYGVYIVSKSHKSSIEQLNESEKLNYGRILKGVTGAFDALFCSKFPYMMYIHQGSVNSGWGENHHFHVEFYSPVRSETSQKINASGETGAWAHVNPTRPEEKAEELRNAYKRYLKACE